MTQTVLADTGPLYAAVAPRDRHHARARAELDSLAVSSWGIAIIEPTVCEAYTLAEDARSLGAYRRIIEPTVCEAYTLVMQRLGLAVAFRWLTELNEGARFLTPTAEDYRAACALVRRYTDQDLTLFDALIAVVSGRTGFPVWTYDHHFDVLRVPVWRT